jgi:hypothetical protein
MFYAAYSKIDGQIRAIASYAGTRYPRITVTATLLPGAADVTKGSNYHPVCVFALMRAT